MCPWSRHGFLISHVPPRAFQLQVEFRGLAVSDGARILPANERLWLTSSPKQSGRKCCRASAVVGKRIRNSRWPGCSAQMELLDGDGSCASQLIVQSSESMVASGTKSGVGPRCGAAAPPYLNQTRRARSDAPYLSCPTGFRLFQAQARALRGRLFLARLSRARNNAPGQSLVLANETFRQQAARWAHDADVAAVGLAGDPNLGVRVEQMRSAELGLRNAGIRVADSAGVGLGYTLMRRQRVKFGRRGSASLPRNEFASIREIRVSPSVSGRGSGSLPRLRRNRAGLRASVPR